MESCVLDVDSELNYEDTIDELDQEDSILNNKSSVISFFDEIEPIIKKCIKNYFYDKRLHNGKKISDDLLDLPYYSSLIFNTTVSDGVIKAYYLMDEYNFLSSTKDISQNIVGEEIRYLVDLISDIQKITPQEFIGGMILMHLELIEGIEIW